MGRTQHHCLNCAEEVTKKKIIKYLIEHGAEGNREDK